MPDLEMLRELAVDADTKMVLVVVDGLGGLPHPDTGLTELESANTPNLDALAADSLCGLVHPVAPGITPGSGPGHMSLFGYDPVRFLVGRGVLSAVGTGIALSPNDVAARVNFCTVENGVVTDRRAGRISTEMNARLCEKLASIKIGGIEVIIRPEKDHRAALVLRGPGLSDELADTDPQKTGLAPLKCEPLPGAGPEAETTAQLVNLYLERAAALLADEHPANMILTRGFAKPPHIPDLKSLYRIRSVGIASYPMYRAVAKLVGMDVADTSDPFAGKVETLAAVWADYDYFFVHHKPTDSSGEDGDFDRKVSKIEEVDASMPGILALEPDVLLVTGDHSTPATLLAHSWHPCPVLLHSPNERRDTVKEFGETACIAGGLPADRADDLMSLMLADALRLEKFGA